jgi:hypothetical protein
MEYKVSEVKSPIKIHTCKNCKLTFSGKICNACGEKVFEPKQLSAGYFFHQVIDFFFHWESKVLKTIKLNFLKPGFVTKENLNGVRVPYAKPIQLYLVVAIAFYFIVTKVGVTDYIPSFGDHQFYSLSTYKPFAWAEPLDLKVEGGIDSIWDRKGREMETRILKNINSQREDDGSYKIVKDDGTDSLFIAADKIPIYAERSMNKQRNQMFHEKVGTLGKTFIFILLPIFASFFLLFFFKQLKYYGAALILATHFMVYNLCFYALNAALSIWPTMFFKGLHSWTSIPFNAIFYNKYSEPFSSIVFGGSFEFIHLLFWMPWLFLAFRRLFNPSWWKNLLISYLCSRIFFYLIFGVLKKVLIAYTIWSIH